MNGRIRLEVIAPDAAQRLHAVSDTGLPEPHSQRNQHLGSHRDRRGDAKNGHHVLADVYIRNGLLRLGADVVEQRVNEALQKANKSASASIDADREPIDAVVAEITAEMPGGQ